MPEKSGTITLRKRRVPLAMMIWSVVGMALISYPLTAARVAKNGMALAARLIDQTPYHAVTLFDKGFIPWGCCTNGAAPALAAVTEAGCPIP